MRGILKTPRPRTTTSRGLVLAELLSGEEMDRARLAASTGLSFPTVARIVDDLLTQGIVLEQRKIVRQGPGRHAAALNIDPRAALVVGIDLGGTHCRMVLADALGRAVVRSHEATPRELAGEELAGWLVDGVQTLVCDHADDMPLRAVAIGLPGVVSATADRVVGSQNLGQIVGTAFVDAITAGMSAPVVVGNDSNFGLRGELHVGGIPEDETAVLFSLGTGLGSAVAIDRHLLLGSEGLLGEFGRLRLPGRRERLRDLVSGAGLVAYARSKGVAIGSAAEIFADREQHAALVAEVREALVHLVSITALAYEPGRILFTGGFSDSLDQPMLDEVRDEVAETVGVLAELRHSRLGQAGGLVGAMAAALGRSYRSMGVDEQTAATVRADPAEVIAALTASPVVYRSREPSLSRTVQNGRNP
jgi:predicted NBD/HSP70 family sugar kinase